MTGKEYREVNRAAPVAALILALASFAAIMCYWSASGSQVEYLSGDGYLGELLPGHSYAETFVPVYPQLSAIGVQVGDYARVNTGTLNLRLIVAGTDDELARAALPKAGIRNNPVVWFNFAPIADRYTGQQLAFEISDPGAVAGRNTVTLFISTRDSYPLGNAFSDARPLAGTDLLLGMRYAAAPFAIWSTQINTWISRVPQSIALVGLLSSLLVVAGSALALKMMLSLLDTPPQPGQAAAPRKGVWRGAALPALLVVTGLANAALWAVIVPPWQGPDEPAHLAYAAQLAKQGLQGQVVSDPTLRASIVAAMDRLEFPRYVPWAPEPGASADRFFYRPGLPADTIWYQSRQPRLYYWLVASVFRATGLAPDGPAWPSVDQVGRLLYAGRFVSVLLHGVLVLLAWLAGRLIPERIRAAAIPFAVALLPMPAHIDAIVNNDVLASVTGALLALFAFRALLQPRRRDIGLLLVSLPLAYFSKGTVLPALGLALLALPLGLWLRGKLALKLASAVGVAIAVAVPICWFVGALDTSSYVQGWQPADRRLYPQRALSATAYDGEYTMLLAAGQSAGQRVYLAPTSAISATAQVWIRATAPASATLELKVTDAGPANALTLAAGPEWQKLSIQLAVPGGTPWLQLSLDAKDRPVEFDDAALELDGSVPQQAGETTGNLLEDPSFETAARVPPQNIPGIDSSSIAYLMLDYLVEPVGLDRFWSDQAQLFQSYWANFGWLAVQLPGWTYLAWALLLILSLGGGLLYLAPLGRKAEQSRDMPLFALLMLGAGVIVGGALFSFLRTISGFKAWGTTEFPQGRYLFSLLVPMVTLLVVGLARLFTYLTSRVAPERVFLLKRMALSAGTILLLAYATLALTSVITFYYGH